MKKKYTKEEIQDKIMEATTSMMKQTLEASRQAREQSDEESGLLAMLEEMKDMTIITALSQEILKKFE